MNGTQMEALARTSQDLFYASQNIFWSALPVAFLLALLMIFASGQISREKIGGLLRRLVIAVALLVALPEVSSILTGLEHSLVVSFGGEETILTLFSRIADHAREVKGAGVSSWIKIGQMGLSFLATVSFMLLSIVQKFLEILRLTLWNILHILGPLAFLACPFPSFDQIPKGIFLGLLEITLWRPIWVILCRLLIAIGFGEAPTDLSNWFDLAIMNFAVAALMVSTPALVHGFLSGTLAGVGGTAIQSMAGGLGAMLAGAPVAIGRAGLKMAQKRVLAPMSRRLITNPAQKLMHRMRTPKKEPHKTMPRTSNTNQSNKEKNGIPKTN